MFLYATSLSSYSLKVRLAAALKGLALEIREPPGGYRSAEYRAIVPAATVPALVDGDFVLAESDTILEYLEDRFAQNPLLPADPQGRARVRFLGRLHDLRFEPKLRACFGAVAGRQPPPDAAAGIAAFLALLEVELDADGPFACGRAPSLADCAFPASFAILDALEPVFGWTPVHTPRIARWRHAMAAHPVFDSVMAPYRGAVAAWIASKRATGA
jgi:glutathione S-transferase